MHMFYTFYLIFSNLSPIVVARFLVHRIKF